MTAVTIQYITVGRGVCAACSQEEVDEVFKAAKAAYKGWAKTPLWKRAEYLHKVAALMKENAKVGGFPADAARTLTLRHGSAVPRQPFTPSAHNFSQHLLLCAVLSQPIKQARWCIMMR
jgi:hypothetical protein